METTLRFASTESFVPICDETPFTTKRTPVQVNIFIYIELPSAPAADNNNNSSISRGNEEKKWLKSLLPKSNYIQFNTSPTESSSMWCSVCIEDCHIRPGVASDTRLNCYRWHIPRSVCLRCPSRSWACCRRQLSYTHVKYNSRHSRANQLAPSYWHRLIHEKNTSLHLPTQTHTQRDRQSQPDRHIRIDLIQFK